MITEIDKEILENFLKNYKTFFVTEYDAADKKLYLRIWLENDAVYFQQDWFEPECKKILFKDIEVVAAVRNRLAIRCNYQPFPDKTIHIEGFEEPLCDVSNTENTMTDLSDIETEIRTNKSLVWDSFFNPSENSMYYIYDLFRLGKIDIAKLMKYKCNLKWFRRIHRQKYRSYTKTLYTKINIKSREKYYGLWDYVTQKPLSENILKKF